MIWLHQAVKFDFTADLAGTGNRSEGVITVSYTHLTLPTKRIV